MFIFDPQYHASLCVDYGDFYFFKDHKGDFPGKDTELGKARIADAESYLDYLPTVLPLSDFRRFNEDGNRVDYENPYFYRRRALTSLVLGELCENEGRFMRKICDILWCILEETTWVIPAHYYAFEPDLTKGPRKIDSVPYDHEEVYAIDLFSAGTAGLVSMVYYTLKDKFENEIPRVMNSRILYELRHKIIDPYKKYNNHWWRTGLNNWNVWVSSNILTTAAVVCEDIEERKYIVSEALKSINIWFNEYKEDGGCDEGAGYWTAAGACFFDALEVLYDLTGGKTGDLFAHPLTKNICDYIRKVNISDNYRFNCADCHPKDNPTYLGSRYLERIGERTGNELMRTFGNSRYYGKIFEDMANCGSGSGNAVSSRNFANNIIYETEKLAYEPTLCEHLPDLQFASMRTERKADSGIYFGIKGGHNAESHNHNDVGNYVIYSDGKPVIIDIGVGTYTKFTFNEMRYKMHFNFRSEGHNLPVICGLTQGEGKQFATTSFDFDKAASSIKMGLEKAYEGSEGVIESYTRSAKMTDNGVELNDDISLVKDGEAQFIYYTVTKPEVCGNTVKLCEEVNLELSANDGISTEEIVFDDENLIKDWGKSIWRITVNAHPIAGKITMRSKFYKD